MKKEILKELGKFHYDVAKIIIGLVIRGRIIKDESIYKQISLPAIFITILLIVVGTILINKGSKDE